MLKRHGYTILELLISLFIGGVIIAATTMLFVNNVILNAQTLKISKLDHDLRTSLSLMAKDARRAGYWAGADVDIGTGANTNPFQGFGDGGDISFDGGNCMLVTYDLNSDGAQPVLNTAGGDERFGYRLRNGVLQMRPDTHSTFDCGDADDQWENVTDPNFMTITALTFADTTEDIDLDGGGPGVAMLYIRRVTITIRGRLVSDTSVERELSEVVRVRNDLYDPD